ncbi:MAG: LPS export ABC transporter permease LptF [bacterium]|nr:LPS export ABC transporter permease LptF [bacterium]
MKVIDRYILKELIPPFGLGIMVFTFVLLMGKILRLTDLIVGSQVPATVVALLLVYLLPSLLVFIIPMSLLFAILIVFGRMSSDNEILALRAAGVPLHRIITPVLAAAIAIFGLTMYVSCFLIPKGNAAFQQLALRASWKSAALGLNEKTFNENLEGLIIYVDQIYGTSLSKVVISDQRKKGEVITIFARRGKLIADDRTLKIVLRLEDGTIHRNNPANPKEYHRLSFATYDLLVHGGSVDDERRDFRAMSMKEFYREIKRQKKAGHSIDKLLIEWHKRFSIPFACVVFALLGCPLGVQSRKGTRVSGFGLSLIIILVYYALLAAGKVMVYGGWLPAWLAMWMPNLLLMLPAVYLLRRIEE